MKVTRLFHASNLSHIDRLCRFLLAFVIFGVSQRYFLKDSADPFKCNALLNNGYWLDPSDTRNTNSYRNWQPHGCMLHKYRRREIQQCLSGQKMIISGDSTSRQLFEALIKRMGAKWEQLATQHHVPSHKHQSMEMVTGKAKITFIWDPYYNDTRIQQELKRFSYDPSTSRKQSKVPAALIFLRAPGLWLTRGGQENYFQQYKETVNKILSYTNSQYLHKMGEGKESSNLLLISPVQIPNHETLSSFRQELLPNERLVEMNQYLHDLPNEEELPLLWSFDAMAHGELRELTHDKWGLHLIENVAQAQVDVLLNLRCNTQMLSLRPDRHDRTCCVEYPGPNTIQLSIMLFSMFLILVIACKALMAPNSYENILSPLTILLTVCLCFVADRTHLFQAEQLFFSGLRSAIWCGVAMLLGLVVMQPSMGSPVQNASTQPDAPSGYFLCRDQIEEWKGWMQVLILLYHYTGASQLFGAIIVNRLLIAAHLFLVGYEHTLEFLQYRKFSFKKMTAVILRLNLLAALLTYMMDTTYLFYYFPALLTFWYLVICITLGVANSYNQNNFVMASKIVLSVALTTTFVRLNGVMEFVYFYLRFIFNIGWNINNLRSQLSLDLYVVYIGMMVAFIRHKAYLPGHVEDLNVEPGRGCRWIPSCRVLSRYLPYMIAVVMLLLNVAFVMVAKDFSTTDIYNRFHPYLSWIPILGYISLRNCFALISSHHFSVFAWLGRMYIETYVLQHHIWLVGDKKGLLRLGMFNRTVQSIILGVLFLWISWRTAEATRIAALQLTDDDYADEDNRRAKEGGYTLVFRDSVEEVVEKAQDDTLTLKKTSKFHIVCQHCMNFVKGLPWKLMIFIAVLWLANFTTSNVAYVD